MATPRARTRPFSADEVLRMVEAGILHEDERLELLDGRLVEMGPKEPRHEYVTALLASLLREACGDTLLVRQESTLACGDDQLPQPDVAVVRGTLRDYADAHPRGV